MNATFRLTVCLLLLSGNIACAPDANAPATGLDIYDGFETSELSKLWSTDRFEPGAVEMQTNVVRAGRSAAKLTVRSGEKFEAGINGNKDSERAELLEARKLVSKENEAYEYSFSDFIATNFQIVPTRLVIAQWKQFCPKGGNCSDDSPVVALRYVSGVLFITRQTGPHRTNLFETSEDLRGKWTDFKFQIRFTTNVTGRIKVWLNGKQVVDYAGATAYPENPTTGYPNASHFYFKMGLYRDVMAEPMTIYIDEYRKRQLRVDEF
ncbi:MAG TPA: polysaccharide lyase [Verrucomicrobiae bacterium]|nr:polysaccharide lyase [Verrucomicrobiae bacterium]